MSSETSGDRQDSSDKNWYTQDDANPPPAKSNRRWWLLGCLIPLPILLCLGVCGGFIGFIFGMLKASDPYVQSLAAAQGNADLIVELGEPIEAGWMVSGEVNLNNNDGYANLSYDISGPKGTATILVNGDKLAGAWSYSQMQATVQSSGKVIDLRPQP